MEHRDLRFGGGDFGFGLRHFKIVGRAGLDPGARDAQVFAAPAHRRPHDVNLGVEGADLEVGRGHLGLNGEQHVVDGVGGGERFGLVGLDNAAQFAPEVDLPGKVGEGVKGRPLVAQPVERDGRGLVLGSALPLRGQGHSDHGEEVAP